MEGIALSTAAISFWAISSSPFSVLFASDISPLNVRPTDFSSGSDDFIGTASTTTLLFLSHSTSLLLADGSFGAEIFTTVSSFIFIP